MTHTLLSADTSLSVLVSVSIIYSRNETIIIIMLSQALLPVSQLIMVFSVSSKLKEIGSLHYDTLGPPSSFE